MNTIKNLLLLFVQVVIICCCNGSEYIVGHDDDSTSIFTKSSTITQYYWYRGKKIPLVTNHKYVNILLQNPEASDYEVRQLCADLHLIIDKALTKGGLMRMRFVSPLLSQDEYDAKLRIIREDERISGAYPFYERGHGAEPIGTSNVFYVRLRGGDQTNLPIDLRQYDLEPMRKLADEYRVMIVKEIPYMPDWYALSIEGSAFMSSIDACNCFFESGLFEDVDPALMFNFRPCATNDPFFGVQWGLKNTSNPDYDINVEGAWTITKGLGAKIAIVDRGVDASNIDLVNNCTQLPSYDAQSGTAPSLFNPLYDHGTAVAGIMVAEGDNNLLMAGVSYESQLMRISHDLIGSPTGSGELASGISWAWVHSVDVINCSWGDQGGEDYNDLHSTILETAISNALTQGRLYKGSVVVFAAGNYGAAMDYPATCDDRILTVGSIGASGYRTYMSAYGTKLDVVAPGENILSLSPAITINYYTGSSYAAPHASGVAALMLSVNPSLTRETVVRFIEQTAKKISPGGVYTYSQYPNRFNGNVNIEVGYGLIDATAAVTVARDAGLTPPNSSPGLNCYIMSGVEAQYDGWCVMGNNQNATAYFSLLSPQISSSYTYYWHFTSSANSGWVPSFDYVGNDTGVIVNIPRPFTDETLTVSCEIYNGSSHICTATRSLNILLNYP